MVGGMLISSFIKMARPRTTLLGFCLFSLVSWSRALATTLTFLLQVVLHAFITLAQLFWPQEEHLANNILLLWFPEVLHKGHVRNSGKPVKQKLRVYMCSENVRVKFCDAANLSMQCDCSFLGSLICSRNTEATSSVTWSWSVQSSYRKYSTLHGFCWAKSSLIMIQKLKRRNPNWNSWRPCSKCNAIVITPWVVQQP